MKISEFIKRLEELREVAGDDVEVAVESGKVQVPLEAGLVTEEYEFAAAELQNVMPTEEGYWEDRGKANTHKIVVVF